MKNILKTLSLLIAFIMIAGTLTIQAAPKKVQLTPKDKHDTKIVIMKEDPQFILYISEKDEKELKNDKEISKVKFMLEPKTEDLKEPFRQMFQPLTKTEFWAIGIGVEINGQKRTIKFNDIQFYDERGEIIVHIGDIYVKNYEELTLEQLFSIVTEMQK